MAPRHQPCAAVALALVAAMCARAVSAQPSIETNGDSITVSLPSRDADLVVAYPKGDPISIKAMLADINGLKDQAQGMLTKDDVAAMIKGMLTKDDVAAMIKDLVDEVAGLKSQLAQCATKTDVDERMGAVATQADLTGLAKQTELDSVTSSVQKLQASTAGAGAAANTADVACISSFRAAMPFNTHPIRSLCPAVGEGDTCSVGCASGYAPARVANVALKKTATIESGDPFTERAGLGDPAAVTDGLTGDDSRFLLWCDDQTGGTSQSHPSNERGNKPCAVTVDLGSSVIVDEVDFKVGHGPSAQKEDRFYVCKHTVEVSADKSKWATVVEINTPISKFGSDAFEPASARYVRFTFDLDGCANDALAPRSYQGLLRLSEVYIYSHATSKLTCTKGKWTTSNDLACALIDFDD